MDEQEQFLSATGGQLSAGEDAVLREAAQLFVAGDFDEPAAEAPKPVRRFRPVTPPAGQLILSDLKPVARIAAQDVIEAPPLQPAAKTSYAWLYLSAAASILVCVLAYHHFSAAKTSPRGSEAIVIVDPADFVEPPAFPAVKKRVETAQKQNETVIIPAPVPQPEEIVAANPPLSNEPVKAPENVLPVPKRAIAKNETVPEPRVTAPVVAEARNVKSAIPPPLPELPAFPQPEPPVAPPTKLATPVPMRKISDAELGRQMDSAQVWNALGNLPMLRTPGRIEISTRNETEATRSGGVICTKAFDLSEGVVSLQVSIENLPLPEQQDFEFFVADELKRGNTPRSTAKLSSISLRRARPKIDAENRKQRFEFIVTKFGAGKVRTELRLDGRVVFGQYEDELQTLKSVYIGFQAIAPQGGTPQGSARRALGIDDVSLMYRPKTIAWSALSDAKNIAQQEDKPFVIFFCDVETAKVAGEGQKVIQDYHKQKNSAPLPTVFDLPLVVGEFNSFGIHGFTKLAAEPANAELFNRYGAAAGTMVVCAPDGSALETFHANNCKQTNVLRYLNKQMKDAFSNWKARTEAAAKTAPAVRTDAIVSETPKAVAPAVVQPTVSAAHPLLRGTYRVGPKLFAGVPLETDDETRALWDLNIKTIIRVDGIAPDAERAARLKARVVHLPIGFSGITPATARTLARALRDLPGPVLIQSSCGYRAYAASLIASVTLGQMEPVEALAAMQSMGVPNSQAGLFAAVKAAAKTDDAALAAIKVDFQSQAMVKPVVRTMVEIDAIWKRLESARNDNWKSPEGKEAANSRDASLLLERYLKLGEMDDLANQPAAFRETMSQSVAGAASLTYSLNAWKKEPTPENVGGLNASFNRVMQSCVNCHAQFRDAEPPKSSK